MSTRISCLCPACARPGTRSHLDDGRWLFVHDKPVLLAIGGEAAQPKYLAFVIGSEAPECQTLPPQLWSP